jgi:excisionase family DNA binding protein
LEIGKWKLVNDSMPKKFLTVNDVARLLGVTPLTVRNWDHAGKLVAYRNPVNNYRLYKVEDVEVLLKQIEHSKEKTRKLKIDIF